MIVELKFFVVEQNLVTVLNSSRTSSARVKIVLDDLLADL